MLLANKTIDAEAIARHPMRHVLTNVVLARRTSSAWSRSVGWQGGTVPAVGPTAFTGRSIRTIQSIMAAQCEPQALAPALVEEALRHGSADNITAARREARAVTPDQPGRRHRQERTCHPHGGLPCQTRRTGNRSRPKVANSSSA